MRNKQFCLKLQLHFLMGSSILIEHWLLTFIWIWYMIRGHLKPEHWYFQTPYLDLLGPWNERHLLLPYVPQNMLLILKMTKCYYCTCDVYMLKDQQYLSFMYTALSTYVNHLTPAARLFTSAKWHGQAEGRIYTSLPFRRSGVRSGPPPLRAAYLRERSDSRGRLFVSVRPLVIAPSQSCEPPPCHFLCL